MKIAVLSDIHGNLDALQAVAADFERVRPKVVVNLGDSLSGPLLPLETARYLMARDWVHIAGNHERQLLEDPRDKLCASDAYTLSRLGEAELRWIASLPRSTVLEGDVFLCHGRPSSDQDYLLESIGPDGVRPATPEEVEIRLGDLVNAAILCGHSHLPRLLRARWGQLILNPGSVGLQAYEDEYPCRHLIENGSPAARYAVFERKRGAWTAELRTVPYDPEPMVKLAILRNRPDWAAALRTGRLNPVPARRPR